MTAAIFVDTNVFVYAMDSANPGKQVCARDWLEQLWRNQSGRTSMQVLNGFYVTMTRKARFRMSPEDAWERIKPLFAWEPQILDRDVMVNAHEIAQRYQLAWWDSLIVASALAQDCRQLLSEDLQDGMRFGDLTVCSPFRVRAGEAPAEYIPDSGLVHRHRPRGRPRKRRILLAP